MSGATLREGLRLAVGTLTVLPSGPVTTSRPVAGAAMALAPLAVLPLALAVLAVASGGSALGLPPFVVATLVVAVLAVFGPAFGLVRLELALTVPITAAPAPSPNSTQVARSFQSSIRVRVSEPTTSTVLAVPERTNWSATVRA